MIPQQKNNLKGIPLCVNVIVTHKNDMPCIELRRATTDLDLIKFVISCAFHDLPMVMQPSFSNKMQSLRTLVEKGIIYRDSQNNQFFFNI